MAQNQSFDVTTGVDLQEVDNAVNQARKEIAQRYDFRGTDCTVELDREAGAVELEADDDYRLKAVYEVLVAKLAKRGVPLKNLDPSDPETGSLGRARQKVALRQGIDAETAKRISKDVKELKLKKLQVQIQGDELRVTSPDRDTLQEVMAFLRKGDYGVELQFGNYR
ncbi:MAG: YajQ family cyclic di-GMP-binding protein [Gemmatimonadales bacterium]|nr:MAG: YajQ family cyclic di-GMP-binding protein [Gemmatimonadales bacterium]